MPPALTERCNHAFVDVGIPPIADILGGCEIRFMQTDFISPALLASVLLLLLISALGTGRAEGLGFSYPTPSRDKQPFVLWTYTALIGAFLVLALAMLVRLFIEG